jgi:hypothetical protein
MRRRRGPVRRFGAALALFALAVQLVLSFGHIHPEDFWTPRAAPALAQSSDAPAPALPGQPGLPTHDDCAICVAMAMAASSALPAPIALPPPSNFGDIAQPLPPRPVIAAAPRLPFQTRAPPAA